MKIIISPAKKMNIANEDFIHTTIPIFTKETAILESYLKSKTKEELQLIWKCNDKIAHENFDYLHKTLPLSPALFSYDGLQYKNIAPGVLTKSALNYLSEHLNILSGYYGIVRAFDGVSPYRLEMQSILPNLGNLYDFWADKLVQRIGDELIINLASKEYSKCITKYRKTGIITCLFCEWVDDTLKEKGTSAKMARGKMVRFLAETNAQVPEDLKKFNEHHFTFSQKYSTEEKFIFIKGG